MQRINVEEQQRSGNVGAERRRGERGEESTGRSWVQDPNLLKKNVAGYGREKLRQAEKTYGEYEPEFMKKLSTPVKASVLGTAGVGALAMIGLGTWILYKGLNVMQISSMAEKYVPGVHETKKKLFEYSEAERNNAIRTSQDFLGTLNNAIDVATREGRPNVDILYQLKDLVELSIKGLTKNAKWSGDICNVAIKAFDDVCNTFGSFEGEAYRNLCSAISTTESSFRFISRMKMIPFVGF